MKKRLVIITWVSCSWKTTLQEELLARWWNRPLNFSTREPRDKNTLVAVDKEWDFYSKELDEYQFLPIETYFTKLKHWDFLEHTNYWGNWYAVSKFLPEWNTCIVLDPVGREQVLEKISRENLDIVVDTFYLDCSKELQLQRLVNRWDTEEEIKKRKKDFEWFSPSWRDMVIDWSWSPKLLADIIVNYKR